MMDAYCSSPMIPKKQEPVYGKWVPEFRLYETARQKGCGPTGVWFIPAGQISIQDAAMSAVDQDARTSLA